MDAVGEVGMCFKGVWGLEVGCGIDIFVIIRRMRERDGYVLCVSLLWDETFKGNTKDLFRPASSFLLFCSF